MSGVSHWNRKEGRSGSLTVESSPGQSYQIVTDESEEETRGKDGTEAIRRELLSLSLFCLTPCAVFSAVDETTISQS